MSLTEQQISEYQSQGFTIVDGFFSPEEVSVMLAEMKRFQDEGLLRNVSTEGDGKTHSNTEFNLQICPISPVSEVLRALPFADKVVKVCNQLIGEAVQHRLDQIFLKPAGNGAGTGWHQDNGYFAESRGQESFQGFGMWISLHDASLENGTMQLIPNMHDQILEHVRDGGSDHHVTCAASVDPDQAVPVIVKAGGVALFNYGVPHATGPNTTDKDRAGLALHFLKDGIETGTHGVLRTSRLRPALRRRCRPVGQRPTRQVGRALLSSCFLRTDPLQGFTPPPSRLPWRGYFMVAHNGQ